MAISDDVNRVWRDFVRFTGDGKPGAPSNAPLPVGDPRSGVHNPTKADMRELLLAILQSMGNEGALQGLIESIRIGSMLYLTDVAGTANAATAVRRPEQTGMLLFDGRILSVQWPATNTSSTVTLSVDGTALTVSREDSTPPQPGDLVGGRHYLLRRHGAGLRIVGSYSREERLYFQRALIVDDGKLLVPAFYHYRPESGFTYYSPTQHPPQSGERYWEFPISASVSEETRIYFDQYAASGTPPVKSVSGNSDPASPSRPGLQLIASTLRGTVHSAYALSGDVPGGRLPNLFTRALDAFTATKYSAESLPVAVTDATAVGLGMTTGVSGTNAYYGEELPQDTPKRGFLFARCYVVSSANNVTAAPKVFVMKDSQEILANYELPLEKIISNRVRLYQFEGAYSFSDQPVSFVIGLSQDTPALTICGGQVNIGGDANGAILRGDYPRPVDPAPLYGRRHFAIAGREQPILMNSLIAERDRPEGIDVSIARAPTGWQDASEAPWRADARDGAFVIDTPGSFTITTQGGDRTRRKRRHVREVQDMCVGVVTPDSPVILQIGDSITNRNIGEMMRRKLVGLGKSPVFVGTINNREASGDPFVLGEGRGGWRASDFIHKTNNRAAVSSASAYLNLDPENNVTGGRWDRNPFIRPATGSDPAGSVFNGHVFDMAFYLSRFAAQGWPEPTHVPIGLGTNDIGGHTPDYSLASINEAMRIMVPSIRAALPNAHICWWLPNIPLVPTSDVKWRTEQVRAIRAMLDYEAELNDPRFSIVSTWAHMDPSSGWSTGSDNSTADQGGAAVRVVSDELHPIGANRHAIAELLTAWVCSANGVLIRGLRAKIADLPSDAAAGDAYAIGADVWRYSGSAWGLAGRIASAPIRSDQFQSAMGATLDTASRAAWQSFTTDFHSKPDDPLFAITVGDKTALAIDNKGRMLQPYYTDFYAAADYNNPNRAELSVVTEGYHPLLQYGADGRLLIDDNPAPLPDAASPAMIPYINGTELRAVGATDELAADLGEYEAITIAPGNDRSVRAVINRPSIDMNSTVSAANGLMIPDAQETLHVLIVLGQSLAVGANAYQTLVMVEPVWPDDALMLKSIGHSDVRLGMQTASGTPMPPADPARCIGFEPLVARASATGNMGQTVAESCATALAQSARDIGIRFRTLSFVAGVGGTTYAGLKKGSQIYANMLIALEKAKALAEERGWRLVVDGCLVKHGESDSANASYQANLIEWQADIDADVKAITGQQAPVHFIMTQPSTSLNGSFASPLAMLAVHNASEFHHLAGADYPFGDFYDTDLLHFLGPGYHLIGEQMARACRQVLWTAAKKSSIVQIIAATRTGTSVVLDYEVPVPPLVFDTTSHTELDVKGFRFVDSTGDVAITDAALTGQAQVTLTLASEPTGTGAYVGYAVRPQTSPRTVEARPRGNLRDSSTELSTYLDRPLYNWAVHQRVYL